jgi:hypothetical protein
MKKQKILNKNIYKIFSLLNNNITNNQNKANEDEQLSKITEDDNFLKDISDNEYRELISKKEEYLETNMRLEKNIKEFFKTENSKLSKVASSIKEKDAQLKIIKEKTKLIEDEVNNLENIYQLSLEKEKIKEEIEKKLVINKKNPEDNNIKEQKKINNIENNNGKKKINKNRMDINKDEVNKNNIPISREEQILSIKKKYMDEESNGKNNENLTDNSGINKDYNDKNNTEISKNKEEENTSVIDYNALKLEQEPFKI